jgi:flagellar biosynthesis/type III secretory pathway protein FliH
MDRQEGIQTGMEKGMEKGKQEGIQTGKQEGDAALLLRLMALRFGPLTDGLRERVQAADAETLLQWGERIFTAETAEEVVGEQ